MKYIRRGIKTLKEWNGSREMEYIKFEIKIIHLMSFAGDQTQWKSL